MIVEGPIVTFISAFAASLDVFNVFFVWILSILASTVMDLMWFSIGRYNGETAFYKYFVNKIGEGRIKRLETYLIDNPFKTIAIIKLTPALPIPGLILSGAIKVPFRKFFPYSSIIVVAYSTLMTVLGYYSGVAFNTVWKYFRYGEIIVGISIISIVIIWLVSRKISKKLSNKIEKI
jgi:membrane protein DedA with SNARE-associated domain